MAECRLGEYDRRTLRGAKQRILVVYEYNYGAPNARRVVNRLETILKKLDELLKEEGK